MMSWTKIGIDVSATDWARENPDQISRGIDMRLNAKPIIACIILEKNRITVAIISCSMPISKLHLDSFRYNICHI